MPEKIGTTAETVELKATDIIAQVTIFTDHRAIGKINGETVKPYEGSYKAVDITSLTDLHKVVLEVGSHPNKFLTTAPYKNRDGNYTIKKNNEDRALTKGNFSKEHIDFVIDNDSCKNFDPDMIGKWCREFEDISYILTRSSSNIANSDNHPNPKAHKTHTHYLITKGGKNLKKFMLYLRAKAFLDDVYVVEDNEVSTPIDMAMANGRNIIFEADPKPKLIEGTDDNVELDIIPKDFNEVIAEANEKLKNKKLKFKGGNSSGTFGELDSLDLTIHTNDLMEHREAIIAKLKDFPSKMSNTTYRFLGTICKTINAEAEFHKLCSGWDDYTEDRVNKRLETMTAGYFGVGAFVKLIREQLGDGNYTLEALEVEVLDTFESLFNATAPIKEIMDVLALSTDTSEFLYAYETLKKSDKYLVGSKEDFKKMLKEATSRTTKVAANKENYINFPKVRYTKMGVVILNHRNNLKYLLEEIMDITCYYDEITRKPYIKGYGGGVNPDDDKFISDIVGQLAVNGAPQVLIEHLGAFVQTKPQNFLIEKIESLEWDGKSRVADFAAKFNSTSGTEYYRTEGMKRFLIQMVAGWDYAQQTPLRKQGISRTVFSTVLMLLGGQGVKKTTAFGKMMPKGMSKYFADGLSLDVKNKDSVIEATGYAFAELGEVDRMMKKADGISDFKAFTTKTHDEYRVPYGKVSQKYPRRTSFCSSSNSQLLLKDPTGARRFFILAVDDVIKLDGFDINQLWAEIWKEYNDGYKWWFTEEDTDFNTVRDEIVSGATCDTEADEVFHKLLQIIDECEDTQTHIFKSPTWIYQKVSGERPSMMMRQLFAEAMLRVGLHKNNANQYTLPKDFILTAETFIEQENAENSDFEDTDSEF